MLDCTGEMAGLCIPAVWGLMGTRFTELAVLVRLNNDLKLASRSELGVEVAHIISSKE